MNVYLLGEHVIAIKCAEKNIIEITATDTAGNSYVIPIASRDKAESKFDFSFLPDYGEYQLEARFSDDTTEFISNEMIVTTKVKSYWRFTKDAQFILRSGRKNISASTRDIVVLNYELHGATLHVQVAPGVELTGEDSLIFEDQVSKRRIVEGYRTTIVGDTISITLNEEFNADSSKLFVYLLRNDVKYRLYFPKMRVVTTWYQRIVANTSLEKVGSIFYFSVNNRLAVKKVTNKMIDKLSSVPTSGDFKTFKYSPYLSSKHEITALSVIQRNDSVYDFNFFGQDVAVFEIWLANPDSSSYMSVPFSEQNGIYTADVTANLNDSISDGETYRLYFVYRTSQKLFNIGEIVDVEMGTKSSFHRYFNSVDIPNNENGTALRLYYNKSGYLKLLSKRSLTTDKKDRKSPLSLIVKDVKNHRKYIEFEIAYDFVKNKDVREIEIHEVYLYKTAFQQTRKHLNIVSIDNSNQTVMVRGELAAIAQEGEYGYLRLGVKVRANDKLFDIVASEPDDELVSKLSKKRVMFNNGTMTFFPSIEGKTLSFFVDEISYIDQPGTINLESKYAKMFKKMAKDRPLHGVILFEKETEYAQDNAYALFTWIQENVPDNDVYYVINRNSRQINKLVDYLDHVIYTGTPYYFKMITNARLLASSDSPLHLVGNVNRRNASPFYKDVIMKKKFIMLQHGVTAMKSHHSNKPWMAKSAMINYFVVTNRLEQKIVHDYMGYDYSQLPILGFSRWDLFETTSAAEKAFEGKIIYVPTWRQWLNKATDEEFVQSDYYHKINDLLTDERLLRILSENNTELNVYLHPFMQRLTHNLMSHDDHIKILSSDDYDLGVLLRGASLIISDYSSVVWDFAIQRKPVVFYQFDQERYLNKVGAMVDLNNLPIGRTNKDVESAVDDIAHYVSNGFEMDGGFKRQVESIFGTKKQNYSEDIYKFLNSIPGDNRGEVWSKK